MDHPGKGSIRPRNMKQQWAFWARGQQKNVWRIRNKVISWSTSRDAEGFTSRVIRSELCLEGYSDLVWMKEYERGREKGGRER